MITETTLEDRIESFGEFRYIHIRDVVITAQDGVETGRAYRRRVLTPDADVSAESAAVRAKAAQEWTPDVVSAYLASLPVPPTQTEIDAAQQTELDAINVRVMDTDLALKAFALIVLDEINLLRVKAGLAERTPLQLKTAHRAKLDTIS